MTDNALLALIALCSVVSAVVVLMISIMVRREKIDDIKHNPPIPISQVSDEPRRAPIGPDNV